MNLVILTHFGFDLEAPTSQNAVQNLRNSMLKERSFLDIVFLHRFKFFLQVFGRNKSSKLQKHDSFQMHAKPYKTLPMCSEIEGRTFRKSFQIDEKTIQNCDLESSQPKKLKKQDCGAFGGRFGTLQTSILTLSRFFFLKI